MMKGQKAIVQILRNQSGSGQDSIEVQIISEDRKEWIVVRVTPEQFGYIVTGRSEERGLIRDCRLNPVSPGDQITDTQWKALRTLGVATEGRFNTELLTGPRQKDWRRSIMRDLLGIEGTVARSGINDVETKLFEVFRIPSGCLAERRRWLSELGRKTHPELVKS